MSVGLLGPGWGMFVIWIYVSVSYSSCQQSGGSVEVAGCLLDTYISIVYIMATIGGCISVGDYIEIGYMLPTIQGVCTSCYVSVGPSRKPVLSGGFSDFSLNW